MKITWFRKELQMKARTRPNPARPATNSNENENATRTSGKNESSVNLDVLILLSAKGGLHSGCPRSMMRCSSGPEPGLLFFGAMAVRSGADSIFSSAVLMRVTGGGSRGTGGKWPSSKGKRCD